MCSLKALIVLSVPLSWLLCLSVKDRKASLQSDTALEPMWQRPCHTSQPLSLFLPSFLFHHLSRAFSLCVFLSHSDSSYA